MNHNLDYRFDYQKGGDGGNEGEGATRNTCNNGHGGGSEVSKRVPGCGGRLDMRCDNGCLVISKVRYSCVGDDSYTYDQLKIVQDICEDKTECKVRATRKVFGNSRCPAVDFGEMTLTVTYYCVGGQDRTKVRIRRKNCKSLRTPGDGNCIGGGG